MRGHFIQYHSWRIVCFNIGLSKQKTEPVTVSFFFFSIYIPNEVPTRRSSPWWLSRLPVCNGLMKGCRMLSLPMPAQLQPSPDTPLIVCFPVLGCKQRCKVDLDVFITSRLYAACFGLLGTISTRTKKKMMGKNNTTNPIGRHTGCKINYGPGRGEALPVRHGIFGVGLRCGDDVTMEWFALISR